MQDEVAKEVVTIPAASSPLKRKKTRSMESLRDQGFEMRRPFRAPEGQRTSAEGTRNHASTSSQPSTPARYRARASMVMVRYDGNVQKQLELLVRNIGTGRNLLRKGKMAARVQALAELNNSDDDESSEDDITAKIQYRHRTGLSAMRSRTALQAGFRASPNTPTIPEALFDTVDKSLEQAQALCEKVAHQVLRDGECQKELDGMRQHFEDVLDTAAKEVEKHKARKKLEEATTVEVVPIVTTASRPISTCIQVDTKRPPSMIKTIPSLPVISRDMTIEIDSEDEDETEFILPPLRMTSRV